MLELLISGQRVDLQPGASITIDEESPVFDSSSIPGGFSYPFTLPVTPKNRRILDFPERLEKSGTMSIEQPFLLLSEGILRLSGTITVMEAGTEYKANLAVGTGDLASKIKDKKLADLDLGGVRTWEWKAEYKYPDDDFALAPVINTQHYKDEPLDAIFKAHYSKVNAFFNGEFFHPAIDDDPWVITPFPFLSYLNRQIFKFASMNVVENVIISDADFRDLILYTIRDITNVKKDYEVATYSFAHGARAPQIITTKVIVSSNKEMTTFDLANSMPDITIADFLLAIRNFLNLAYVVDGDTVRIIKRKDLVLKPTAIEITDQAIGKPNILSVKTDGFKLDWSVDGDDDLWAEDFYKNLDSYLPFIKDPVQSFEDLEDLEPDQNEIRYIIDEDLFARYIYFAYDPEHEPVLYRWQWVGWSLNYQNYRSGNAVEVFSSIVAPILTTTAIHFTPPTAGYFKGPWVEQKGAISDAGIVPAFALRLLFYRGLDKDSLNADIPLATNDNLNRVGELLPGKNLCLKFEGEYGIYAQLYQHYLSWWMDRRIVKWTIKNPSELKFHEKYAIDGKHYLLKKRTVNHTEQGIMPAECEFYLV